jgi:SAM-dependent methyltransferase
MHASVMRFLRERVVADEILGLDVLEVGSQDVNGSPREVLAAYKPKSYVGVDFATARGVDVVLDVKDLTKHFGPESFDVVISTEMLEHAEDWRTAISQMKSVLKQSGLLVVTARGPGFPYHGYPYDFWRYTVDDWKRIFSDMWILHLDWDTDPCCPGVFLKARKTGATGSLDLSAITVAPVPGSTLA